MWQNGDQLLHEYPRCSGKRHWRAALAAWLLVLSMLSATAGLAPNDAVAASSSFSVEGGAKAGSNGDIAVDVTYQGAEGDTLVFRVAMDTMKMAARPLADYDLLELAHLVVPGAAEIRPARWTVEQTGHMGHHVRGALAFKLTPDQRASLGRAPAAFEIVVSDVGGVPKRTFAFKTTPRVG